MLIDGESNTALKSVQCQCFAASHAEELLPEENLFSTGGCKVPARKTHSRKTEQSRTDHTPAEL